MESVLTKNQKKIFGPRYYTEHGRYMSITATVRYDDECGNGHNTFSITADIKEKLKNGRGVWSGGGCCHEEIAKHFPELAPFIKWHLFSSDGPMHYPSNTLYYAGARDCWGTLKGEVRSYALKIKFKNFPVTFNFKKSFIKWVEQQTPGTFKIHEIPHKPDPSYNYSPKYTFHGFAGEWYQCPFDDKQEAEEWAVAFNTLPFEVVKTPDSWGEGKEPELEAARSCAVWPDATLEQLQNKELLMARLPGLIAEFKKDVESLGFIF